MSSYVKDYIEEEVSKDTHEEDEGKNVETFRIVATDNQVISWLDYSVSLKWTILKEVIISDPIPEKDLEQILRRNEYLDFKISKEKEFVEASIHKNTFV